MPKRPFSRYLPNPATVREHPALRPVRRWLYEADLWHMNRRSVSVAVLVGLFCAFLPIPFQMVFAAAIGIAVRCNLGICIPLVWLTNPVTQIPISFFCYEVGAWLLSRPTTGDPIALDWEWLSENMGNIGIPLLVGSLICGAIAGLAGYLIVRVGWRLHVIARWRLRRDQRRVARLLATKREPPGDH